MSLLDLDTHKSQSFALINDGHSCAGRCNTIM